MVNLEPYTVPQDFSKVKLNQNESPADIPADIKEEIFARLRQVSWNRYPWEEAPRLIEGISRYTDFPSSGIMAGNGSNELIQTLMYAVCDSGDRIVTVRPGFSVYKRVATVMNIRVTEVPLKENFSFDVEAMVEKARRANLVIFASPNNPTGTVLPVEEIERIARHTNGFVAVDEAYYEFHQKTAQRLINESENIVVLRTFSKALGLAGIRLGYLLGRKDLVKEIRKAKLPFSIGQFQQIAGEVILEKKKFIEENTERIIREKERLWTGMKKAQGICPVFSCANFILFRSESRSSKELYARLHKSGVIVRRFEDPSLKNMLRVTVGTQEENRFFLEKLNRAAEGYIS